jgi:hypothetical protein
VYSGHKTIKTLSQKNPGSRTGSQGGWAPIVRKTAARRSRAGWQTLVRALYAAFFHRMPAQAPPRLMTALVSS